jgi:EAL domain-containing protein (putative c-di-GMP-specific phosphodiesterase class I)
VHTLHLLKAEGFKISMDDFGTGFSSLSMLRKIPLNEIKIDKSFVDDVTTDESAEYVTKTILLIANQLGYEAVIAEGAETVEQVDKLVGQGCSLFQGYYFSKPVDIQQLECYIGA